VIYKEKGRDRGAAATAAPAESDRALQKERRKKANLAPVSPL